MIANRKFVAIVLLLALTALPLAGARATTKIYGSDFIVMFGDSITYGGEWEFLLKRTNIINDGVVGDTTRGFQDRIRNVYFFRPRICFIMGGINDIAKGVRVNHIFDNLRQIAMDLMSQDTIPVIQATLYTRNKKYNAKLREFAATHDLDFIDLNVSLTNGRMLNRKFTFDGIHLQKRAYRIWAEEVEKVLTKYNL